MSLDLSWSLLDEGFTDYLLTTLDNALHRASKPDFIGPIHLSSLYLGNEAPEVSIVDIGDVWQGFLDRGDGDDHTVPIDQLDRARSGKQPRRTSDRQQPPPSHDHFAKFAEKNLPFTSTLPEEGRRQSGKRNNFNRLQMFRQYSDSGQAHPIETGSVSSFQDQTMSIPQTPASSHWGPGLLPADRPFSSHGSNAGGYFPAWQGAQPPASHRSLPTQRPQTWRRSSSSLAHNHTSIPAPPYPGLPDNVEAESPSASSTSALPSLQLHLSLHWSTSTIRVTVNTSLLINHPSPAFMSLPLSITITGLVLQAGGLMAFEVDQITNLKKAHFCLVVEEEEEEEEEREGEEDEEIGDEEQEEGSANKGSQRERTTESRTLKIPSQRSRPPRTPTNGAAAVFGTEQQVTPGERILSNVSLETSVGQVDKHVLRNVAKVERFVVSLVRKAIGDELVFPNFYSVELP